MITECQERAIIAGNKIEQQEGEGTYAVKLLEDYCAALLKDVADEIEKDILNMGVLPEKVRRIDMNEIRNVKIDSLMS